MNIFFTTVVRRAPIVRAGELIKLNWRTRRVERRVAITPSRVPDNPNPRGGPRGGRGIALVGDRLVVGSDNDLQVYDFDLRLERRISHPLFAGLHEFHADQDHSVWVTSTDIDAALKVDVRSGEVTDEKWPRDMPGIAAELGLEPLHIDRSGNAPLPLPKKGFRQLDGFSFKDASHLHLNALSRWQGRLIALFHSFGVIADLTEDRVLIQDDRLKRSHNLVVNGSLAYVNDSFGQSVRAYDLMERRPVRSIHHASYPWVARRVRLPNVAYGIRLLLHRNGWVGPPIARPLFGRGMSLLGERLWIGIAPASILEIDLRTGGLDGAFPYSSSVNHTIHGVLVHPEAVASP